MLLTLIAMASAGLGTVDNVLYYSFDDANLSGSDPLDLTPNNNDGTNNVLFFKIYPPISPDAIEYEGIGGLPLPGSILGFPLEVYVDNSLSLEDRQLDIISQKQSLSDVNGCPQGDNYRFETVLGSSEVLETGDDFSLEVDKIGCQDGSTQVLFFKVNSDG